MRCPVCNGFVYKCDSSPYLKNSSWYQLLHHCTGCGRYFTLTVTRYKESSGKPGTVKYPEEIVNEETA